MLKTIEQKKKYIQETRLQNYQASLKLEGIATSCNLTQFTKAQILQKYKKYSQSGSQLVTAMDKYGELGDSLYCYPDTNILKNKLNIRDEMVLEQAELELSGISSSLIEYAEPPYDLQYLKSIHAQLFDDLYDWAGQLRQIDISKGNSRFCTFPRIEIEANKLLTSLQEQNYFQGLEPQQLISKLADLYCELNVIHPFREGNGRTQRIFFEHLIAYCGYGIDWSKIKSQEQWTQANIEGFYGNLQPLIQIFESCLIIPD